MDTTDWTVEDHINWIRQYADSARILSQQVLSWKLDVLGTYAGTVEVVPWPEVDPSRRLRRGDSRHPERPEGTRMIIANGIAYLVKDVK